MRAWIGLGSNVGNGPQKIEDAIAHMQAIPGVLDMRRSGLYRSAPWGRTAQRDFTNAVAELQIELAALDLLAGLQAIEAVMGRTPSVRRWGPRVIDLDILLLDDHIFRLPKLIVPHPRMHLRRFVLLPLHELDTGLEIPGRGSLASCLGRVAGQAVTRID